MTVATTMVMAAATTTTGDGMTDTETHRRTRTIPLSLGHPQAHHLAGRTIMIVIADTERTARGWDATQPRQP